MNRNRDIMLNIKTTQNIPGEEPLIMDFVTEGKLIEEDGLTYLTYEESDVLGISGQEAVLIIEDNRVIMRKNGPYNTDDMVFVQGKKDTGVYSTDFGDFNVEFFTRSLQKDVAYESGRVFIQYDLAIRNLSESENTIEIEYR